MGIGGYIIVWSLIIFWVVMLLKKLYDMNTKASNDLLDEMYKDGDISEEIYKKYKFKK